MMSPRRNIGQSNTHNDVNGWWFHVEKLEYLTPKTLYMDDDFT